MQKTFNTKSFISRVLKHFDDTGSFESLKTPGRPHKTTPKQNQAVQKLFMVDSFDTTTGIARRIAKEFGMKISRETV